MRLRRRSSGGAASNDVGAVLSTHVDVGAVLSTHVDVGSRAPTSTHDVDSCVRGLRCVGHLGPRMQLRCIGHLGPPLDVGLEMGDSIGSGTVGQRSLGG